MQKGGVIMNQKSIDYILDFTIPAGATGPQGIPGPTGPTGPTNTKSILSYMYLNTSTSELLTIDANNEYSIILPQNNTTFESTDNTITIMEDGYYVFSISGTLNKTTSTGDSSLTLNIGTEELITVVQNANLNEMHFSQTKMKQCQANNTVTIRFNKDSSSDTSTNSIYLIITQFVL